MQMVVEPPEWGQEFADSIVTPPGWDRRHVPYLHWVRLRDPLLVIMSGRVESDGRRWIHVSASHPRRTPTWDTMCEVKRLFLGDRLALQLHPPRSQYVNIHAHCLHLWCCLDDLGLPDFRFEGMV